MSEWLPLRVYRTVTHALGAWRGLFLPIGIAALVAMGVHRASEHVVEWSFVLLGWFDLGTESIAETILGVLSNVGILDDESVVRGSYAFAAFFDLDDREYYAKLGGLATELYVDVYLVWAALGYVEPRAKPSRLRAIQWQYSKDVLKKRLKQLKVDASYYLSDMTVEKVYLPLGAALAVLGGTSAVGQATENALYAAVPPSRLLSNDVLIPWSCTLLQVALIIRLGWPMFDHALDRAEARNEDARISHVPERSRRLRGLVRGIVVLSVLGASLASGPLMRFMQWVSP